LIKDLVTKKNILGFYP